MFPERFQDLVEFGTTLLSSSFHWMGLAKISLFRFCFSSSKTSRSHLRFSFIALPLDGVRGESAKDDLLLGDKMSLFGLSVDLLGERIKFLADIGDFFGERIS